MPDPTKEELAEQAEAAGVEDADHLSKRELRERLEGQAPAALGPVIPEGHEPPAPRSGGRSITGVQPVDPSEIPEAGR